ncbi:penicillin-binding protein activator [Haliea sp. E17]|uniref:penicillin-binding protein activator n=1 Tax=Haliea sp. E17 TaxID=3401576 RepID=UPI003AB06DFB
MTALPSPPFRRIRWFLCTAALALLGACAGGPRPVDETPTVAVSTVTRPQAWRVEPEPVATDSDWEPEFAAAEEALQRLNWMDAETALRPLESSPLNAYDGQQLAFFRARIAHVRGKEADALEQLAWLEQANLPPELDYKVYAFHQRLLHLTGDYLEAARQGLTALQFSGSGDKVELKQAVWRDLQRSRNSELQSALAHASDPEWQGWLELALLARQPERDLGRALQQWEAAHPAHSAAHPLPGGLEELAQNRQRIDHVALILPLSGRLAAAGQAVRDGYLAGYFQARELGSAPSHLTVIDSETYPGAIEAYQYAVASGAQLVIGPLRKESVAELDALIDRPVPIIALNRVDGFPRTESASLFQLALAPEDEVRCLADRAFGEGIRRILVLRPAGEWGDKAESTLQDRWASLGGSIADRVTYSGTEEYSESVKAGLGIAASEARRTRLREMLATNIEFTPRRRQDIDAVILLSPGPADARALKPLLAFYYAGSLPVYAPSGVYSGHPDNRDRDLTGVRVVEIPWLLDSDPSLRGQLTQAGLEDYPRLNALGADAYLLQSRLSQLDAGPAALLRGNTGLLSLNTSNQVERDLPLAEFDGGRLKPR